MKKIEIHSGEPITEDVIKKIRGIFVESECPNESMMVSIPEFTSFDEGTGIVRLVDGTPTHEEIITFDDTK